MTDKLFLMVNKMSPNFKSCPDQNKNKKLINKKKVIAHLTLPCDGLRSDLIFSKKCNISQNKKIESKIPSRLDKYAMTLITKFKSFKNDENCQELLLSKTNKPFVEILAFKKHSTDKYWMIPSGRSQTKNLRQFDSIPLKDKKCPKQQELTNQDYEIVKDLYAQIFINSKIIYKGYLNDGGKNKNSLIEVIAENCHHFNDRIIFLIEKTFQRDFLADNFCLKWLDIYDKKFYPPHTTILKKCAIFLNAEWID